MTHLVNGSCKSASTHGCLGHDPLKRTQSVVERTFAATANEVEVGLKRPIALVVSILKRGNYGSKCLALKFAGSNGSVHVVCEQRIIVLDDAVLVGQLPVEGKMMTFAQECHTGRVVINTVYRYRCLTAQHTVESDVLICVCQQASCQHVAAL